MLRVLITGGAGMIGSNLAKRMVRDGYDVTIVDNLWRGNLDNLRNEDGNYIIELSTKFYNLDLREQGCIDSLLKNIDYVFHLADVVAGIGYVFGNQGSIFRDNFLINTNVFNAIRKNAIKGLLYVGTACSFPAHKQFGVNAPPLKEEDQYPACPESAYGWSKLMGEYEALLLSKETGIPTSILSLHNVYGTPSDFNPKTSQVIPSIIYKAIKWPLEDFIVWGHGNQGRAFVHVDDVIEAIMLSVKSGFNGGLIQIGPNICTSIREIAEIVIKISGKNIPIKY
jgi:nucleoside-diphosphate-sugar epimerase